MDDLVVADLAEEMIEAVVAAVVALELAVRRHVFPLVLGALSQSQAHHVLLTRAPRPFIAGGGVHRVGRPRGLSPTSLASAAVRVQATFVSVADSAEHVKAALLDAVVDLAEQRQPGAGAAVAGELLRHYFRRTPPQDFVDKDPIDLYGATIRHLQLAERRDPSQALIRIYNPNSDEDGWSSSHTVIDIVTDDMPFIVDSTLALFEVLGYQVHVLVHPMFIIERSSTGAIETIQVPTAETEADIESALHIEIDRLTDPAELADLRERLHLVLDDVRAAVEDWMRMRDQAIAIADELDRMADEAEAGSPRFQPDVGGEPREVAELLRWMEDGSFVFVGYREYDLHDDPENPTIVSRPTTGLGTLRQREATTRDLGLLPPETAAQARRPNVLNLTKANAVSTVHRATPLDYVGIKKVDETGRVTGERRFLGMFTSAVYSGRVEHIPSVRVKVKAVTDSVAFTSTSHDHNRLLNTLQTYPRDELFQIDVAQLEAMALQILDLRDRRQVSLLMRRDLYGRFLSCLVYVPRDRHSTEVRLKIQNTLMEMYQGKSVRYSTEISDAPLARLHLVIYTDPVPADELPATQAVEARLVQVTRTWDDFLRSSLIEAHGEEHGIDMTALYGSAFSESYRSQVLAESAVHDIDRLQGLGPDTIDVFFHRPLEAGRFELRCKVYRAGDPIALSQLVPLLHDLGAIVIDERPYEITPPGSEPKYIYDIGLEMDIELGRDDRLRVRESVLAAWDGEAKSDGLARLVISADLTWQDVSVLRAYSRYLLQIGSRFSFGYLVDTLNAHPATASLLVELFHARLDPATSSVDAVHVLTTQLSESIDAISSLDADHILRSLWNAIEATLRTNHWQTNADGRPRDALALKIDPAAILDMPMPVPAAEIFVYSPRTEGVHLRSGMVARGGLRWSERLEDYRTEILGLMKAQTVKNSVIVPVGAKGGFIVRHLPAGGSRDEVMAEVVACYKIFVGSMLDVTDNNVDGHITSPPETIRQDGDDPYLVVAADKGTATFSDIANEIATERSFWLDDAFASGGSAGYDHKALAITARGAWVSVEQHFASLGLDPATRPFTVVGIGDMSGDVFGNGLLQSDQAKLIGAFDHRHVFIDPDPDPATSYAERQRLFELPRSTWHDYNRDLISAGGGVFPRTAKSIPVSPEIRAALSLDSEQDTLTPDELIKAVLLAPVDLLWNGGIGTYIKSSEESDSAVSDRGNDGVRVDGAALRCRVVAEGGNLGASQLGRIEYTIAGGLINTDAIDNSGGVDCSDHEVNLKILLAVAERNGDLTRKQRNLLLESMAAEVCDLVLANNYAQNRTLAAAVADAPGMVQVHERVMNWLSETTGLDRSVEFLPSTLELEERRSTGQGLTRPELAVLLAYTKNSITEDLVASPLSGNGGLEELLFDYFPSAVREQHPDLVRDHPLRGELMATLLSNQVVNRGGISMAYRLAEETSATMTDIALAHLAAWKIFELDHLLAGLRGLECDIDASAHTFAELELMKLGERATRWLLRNEAQPLAVDAVVERYQPAIRSLLDVAIGGHHPTRIQHRIETLVAAGVVRDLAAKISWLGRAYGFLDLATIALGAGRPLDEVAAVHALVEAEFDLAQVREWVVALPRTDHWQTMARGALRDQYFAEHAELTAAVLEPRSPSDAATDLLESWLDENPVAAGRFRRTFADIAASTDRDLAQVSVAVRALAQLNRAS